MLRKPAIPEKPWYEDYLTDDLNDDTDPTPVGADDAVNSNPDGGLDLASKKVGDGGGEGDGHGDGDAEGDEDRIEMETVLYDERFDDVEDESGDHPRRLTRDRWAMEPPRDKQSRIDRGMDLSRFNIWEPHMLNYCVHERQLAPGEGMVIFVVGDGSVPIGARLLRTVNLGLIPRDREQQTGIIKDLVEIIRRLLGPPKGSWAWAAAQAANVPPENQ